MKYIRVGNSDKFIFFLHGWGADKSSFLWVKNYLENFSLVFVDFSGFGESEKPEKPFFVKDYVEELYELIKMLNAKDIVLVGHSFGGRVAIKFAFLHQMEFEGFKICLVDAAGIKPRRGLSYYFKIHRYKRLKKLAEKNDKFKAKLKECGSSDYKVLCNVMKRTFVNVVNEDLSCNAKYIKCKTLIVWGDNDLDTKLYMAKKLNKLIKNSYLHIIKGAGHYSFLDNPSEFLILLDTFVKN